MFCTCKNPKTKPMKVYHKEFFVCAKSEGGCGCEIAEGKARVLQGCRGTVSIGGKVVGTFNNVSYNVNPHNKVTCPRCNGKCTVQKFVGFGLPAKDVTCDYCDGAGKV